MTRAPNEQVDGLELSVVDLQREQRGGPDADGSSRAALGSLDARTGFETPAVALDEAVVKDNLDAILLALVRTTDGETHGKALMNRLSSLFGVHLSPGTLYPRLHALEESGLLRVQERVRTKEYSVADGEAVEEFVERTARQHLVLGRMLRDALVVDAEAESPSVSPAE